VKHQFRYHLLASVVLFTLIGIFLIISRVNNIELLLVFLGIFSGTFILDSDHLIYWFFLKPNTEESRLVKLALKNHDFISIIKLINIGRLKHHNLIFHHYFFQIVLVLFSFFIFTSTNSIFVSSLVLSLNFHLIIDEVIDYLRDPKILQKWLFAREPNQLPIKFLGRYLTIFCLIFLFFLFLFIKMNS
jgi:hypothetical protein